MDIQIAIIGLLQAVSVAVIGGIFALDSKKKKKMLEDSEAHAMLRAEESRLAMKLLSADVNLSVATARAVMDGKSNGKIEIALETAEKATLEYYDFINTVAVKQISQ